MPTKISNFSSLKEFASRDFSSRTVFFLVPEAKLEEWKSWEHSLKSSHFDYAGAVFPKVIFQGKVIEDAVLALPLPTTQPPLVYRGKPLSLECLQHLQGQTLITIAEGLSRHTERLLGLLYGELGSGINYIGAGAGCLAEPKHKAGLLFTKADGFFSDAILLFAILQNPSIFCFHGWSSSNETVVATQTEGTTIKQLNWEPAGKAYCDILESLTGETISEQNFSHFAAQYPFGILVDGKEFLIRDPVNITQEGYLWCVGEIPNNAMLHIMNGNTEKLLENTRRQMQSYRPESGSLRLIFDCISRSLLMEERIEEELEALGQQAGIENLHGALSFGEIASGPYNSLRFLNKSVVISELREYHAAHENTTALHHSS